MATYSELNTLISDPALSERVGIGLLVAAQTILDELPSVTNHANRLKWAKKVLTDPNGNRDDMLRAVLAANNTLTLAQITSATDAQIQAKIDAAVDIFADGV